MSSAEQVIDAFYAALFRRDADAARSLCAAGAEYHALSPFHEWHGTYSLTAYVDEVAPRSLGALPDYRAESMERDVLDELLVVRLRSSWADPAAAGGRKTGAGVMVFRVVEGKITDLWVINAAGRDAPDPF